MEDCVEGDAYQVDQLVDTSVGRRTYLITYSQADLQKFESRQGFGEMIQRHFDFGNAKAKTDYWACCREPHKRGGEHYHLSLKLTGVKKWFEVKCRIEEEEGIVVNFSNKHSYYIAAYKYVTKSDEFVCHSGGHPNLKDVASPQTKRCTIAYRNKRRSLNSSSAGESSSDMSPASSSNSSSSTPRRPKIYKPAKLTPLEVSNFISENQISSSTELLAAAHARKEAGQNDMVSFILSRSSKCIEELLTTTFRLNKSSNEILRRKTSRIDMIRQAKEGECIANCETLWLRSAVEVLTNNKIHPVVFAEAMRELLIHGRGKSRNILLIGERNCGKTFLLKPLEVIFNCFTNPAKDKYAWVGAEEAEVIILQDFRWDSETIAWKAFLLLLEGENVKLPAPKNQFAKDLSISTDVPIFATSIDEFKFKGPNNSTDEREDRMMECRWRKPFKLFREIPLQEQRRIEPCGRCFGELILMGEIA